MINNQLDKFEQSLKEKRFFDAHEDIESIWFPKRFEDNNEIRLLKGFINAAVSFELQKRGKNKQSKRVWKTYLKYRQLLHKISSPHLSKYYKISRIIDTIKSKA